MQNYSFFVSETTPKKDSDEKISRLQSFFSPSSEVFSYLCKQLIINIL